MRHPLKIHALPTGILFLALALGPLPAPAQPPSPGGTGTPPGSAPWRPKPEESPLADAIPDTTVLLRVGTDVVTVKDYIRRYHAAYPETRPETDSAGRKEFLGTLEKALLLRRAALDRNRPLDFGERAVMREHTDRVLSNVLYQRAIIDSSEVSESELRELYSMLKTEIRIREITFRDLASAQRVYDQLTQKRITWERAYQQNHELERKPDLGDLGWIVRTSGEPGMVSRIFRLQPGEIAEPWQDMNGAHVVQCTDTRPANPLSYEIMRDRLRGIVRTPRMEERTEAISRVLRDRIGMTYDTTNIVWAAQKFEESLSLAGTGGAPVLQLNMRLPTFSSADTGRVLARHRDGQLTLRQFMNGYRALPSIARPAVNTPDRMRAQVDAIALEPYRTELARERGYEKDSLAVEWIARRYDEIIVDRLYQDSVASHVRVTEADVRRYYEANRAQYITFPSVTYALWVATRKSEADSMLARVQAGEPLDAIVRADSIAGRPRRGSVRLMRQNEQGADFHAELFGGELRPGDGRVFGPDQQNQYAVVQFLSFDAGRQLSLEEAYRMVDERVRDVMAEQKLEEFVSRLRRKIKVEKRPELLMRFAMRDPTL